VGQSGAPGDPGPTGAPGPAGTTTWTDTVSDGGYKARNFGDFGLLLQCDAHDPANIFALVMVSTLRHEDAITKLGSIDAHGSWEQWNPDQYLTGWSTGMTTTAFFRNETTGQVIHLDVALLPGVPCTFAGTVALT
jgi:hypothetical protein